MEWISVEKELPIEEDYYLVSSNYGIVVRSFNVYHNCWDDEQADDYWCDAVGGNVTHWMPLPPPPSSHNSEYKQCEFCHDTRLLCSGAGECDHDGRDCSESDNCGEYTPALCKHCTN